MLRTNATRGIHLPEGNSKWSVEKTLRQWKIAQSLATNGRKVNNIYNKCMRHKLLRYF